MCILYVCCAPQHHQPASPVTGPPPTEYDVPLSKTHKRYVCVNTSHLRGKRTDHHALVHIHTYWYGCSSGDTPTSVELTRRELPRQGIYSIANSYLCMEPIQVPVAPTGCARQSGEGAGAPMRSVPDGYCCQTAQGKATTGRNRTREAPRTSCAPGNESPNTNATCLYLLVHAETCAIPPCPTTARGTSAQYGILSYAHRTPARPRAKNPRLP